MQAYIRKVYDRAGDMVHSSQATTVLGVLFYLDALFFLPMEPLLILYCMERPQRAWWYATVATGAAVLGGITSYYIGTLLWATMGPMIIHHPWVNYVISPQTFNAAIDHIHTHQGWALIAIGFMPIPFKVTTLCAGFCRVSLIYLIASACIVRGVRFFGCALFMTVAGKHIKECIDRYGILLILLLVLVGIGMVSVLRIGTHGH